MKNIKGSVVKINGSNVKVCYSRVVVNTKYLRTFHRNSFLIAHTNDVLKVGDIVNLRACAPISKTKHYIAIKEEK